MKTTFKKTMAALSAAAVVAASAAVMAMPASAEGSITIDTVEITESQLAAANYEVSVPIIASNDFTTLAVGMTLDEGLTFVAGTASGGLVAADANGQFVWYALMNATELAGASTAAVTVTVESTAKAGDVYNLVGTPLNTEGVDRSDLNGTSAAVSGGSIVIVEDPTEAPTDAPTDAPTEAPTDAPVATPTPTTAPAPTATSTTKPSSSSSPKTGDALPIAGVAVAVAVIGGVALVSKKRK